MSEFKSSDSPVTPLEYHNRIQSNILWRTGAAEDSQVKKSAAKTTETVGCSDWTCAGSEEEQEAEAGAKEEQEDWEGCYQAEEREETRGEEEAEAEGWTEAEEQDHPEASPGHHQGCHSSQAKTEFPLLSVLTATNQSVNTNSSSSSSSSTEDREYFPKIQFYPNR